MDGDLALPLEELSPGIKVRWFAPHGCVVERGSICEVTLGGTMIGQFEPDGADRSDHNVLVVTLARDSAIRFNRLAWSFGMSEEYLRLLRRKAPLWRDWS